MPISLSSRWWINQLPKDLLPDYAKANLHTILDLTVAHYDVPIKRLFTLNGVALYYGDFLQEVTFTFSWELKFAILLLNQIMYSLF